MRPHRIAYCGLVPYAKDPRVDAYIDALPRWQQRVCHRVRELVHGADPAVEETIKRRVQPYFVCEGNVCALPATTDHVNVFLYDGGIVPDREAIITAGHDNKTARTVAVRCQTATAPERGSAGAAGQHLLTLAARSLQTGRQTPRRSSLPGRPSQKRPRTRTAFRSGPRARESS
jgi:hypothetical protein